MLVSHGALESLEWRTERTMTNQCKAKDVQWWIEKNREF
jgi:hypothetical protein